MADVFEQDVLLQYVSRLARDQRIGSKEMEVICGGTGSFMSYLETVAEEAFFGAFSEFTDQLDQKIVPRKVLQCGRKLLVDQLTLCRQRLGQVQSSNLQNNLDYLAGELELDDIERDFFSFVLRYYTHDSLQRLCDDLTRCSLNPQELSAICLGCDRAELAERLRPGGRLLASGVLRQSFRNGSDIDDTYEVPDTVRIAVQKSTDGPEDIRRLILGEPQKASLVWEDFEHLGETHERLGQFLQAALAQRIVGVNVLLWGPPGTGKTELCKTLAQRLNVRLYAIGEQDDDGGEPTRRERIGYLQLAQNLLRYQRKSLLLFDEMDDLFEGNALARLFGGKASMGSKVFTNRLFEQNPVPTLWVLNDVEILDAAIVRRMSLAIELKVPPASVRQRVWQRVLDKNALSLPNQQIRHLAELDIAPAVVDNAARVAREIGGRMEDFQFAADGLVRVLSGPGARPTDRPQSAFHLDLMRCDTDLAVLRQQVAQAGKRDFSLCLYGPPGTGKSAFVCYLAETLGMPVLFKRASDLLNAYVGQTEQRIAAAFREARDKEAFLVFDEADSLLGDRRYAQRNWEVTQVNEMLTWMETHPLPFACTTNLMDRIDQASLRRFTFKCHCDSLGLEQLSLAFERFFGLQLPATELTGLAGLTPGDFALVHKKARLLNCAENIATLIEMLRQEVQTKNERRQRPIGFGQS
ncbi:MAG: AAA family ATPase [Desulfovibrio desulfuricans]|nr:AAA family ATPase [Desulfovibrio desulfuricans]